MRFPILLIVVSLVLAEIAAFILVGELIGVPATLGLVLLGMLAGAVLLRRTGIATLARVRTDVAARQIPARSLVEGAVLALAALLLIIPGFVSDFVGIALFIPAVREGAWRWLRRRMPIRPGSADAASASGAPVIDLDRSEFGESARPSVRPDSLWRSEGSGR
jgi:UPF0716 protein FxsA